MRTRQQLPLGIVDRLVSAGFCNVNDVVAHGLEGEAPYTLQQHPSWRGHAFLMGEMSLVLGTPLRRLGFDFALSAQNHLLCPCNGDLWLGTGGLDRLATDLQAEICPFGRRSNSMAGPTHNSMLDVAQIKKRIRAPYCDVRY
jgi:hypothetical protein